MSKLYKLEIINTEFRSSDDIEVLASKWESKLCEIDEIQELAAEINCADRYMAKQSNHLHSINLVRSLDRMSLESLHKMRLSEDTEKWEPLGCTYYRLYDENGNRVPWKENDIAEILHFSAEMDPKEIISEEHKFPLVTQNFDRTKTLEEFLAEEQKENDGLDELE